MTQPLQCLVQAATVLGLDVKVDDEKTETVEAWLQRATAAWAARAVRAD